MSNSPIVKEAHSMDFIEECLYQHIGAWPQRWKYRLYLSETGASRIASIAGYLVGLKHGGNDKLAEALSLDFTRCLEYLCPDNVRIIDLATGTFQESEEELNSQVIKVPATKVILFDDGCLHSFGFKAYRPLAPVVYERVLNRHAREIEEEKASGSRVWDTAHSRTVKELSILERMNLRDAYSEELTEHKYNLDTGFKKIYYVPGYHGGLIYQGPGAGQTFSVNLDRSTFWGIHT
jgi:hypothetical protein